MRKFAPVSESRRHDQPSVSVNGGGAPARSAHSWIHHWSPMPMVGPLWLGPGPPPAKSGPATSPEVIGAHTLNF